MILKIEKQKGSFGGEYASTSYIDFEVVVENNIDDMTHLQLKALVEMYEFLMSDRNKEEIKHMVEYYEDLDFTTGCISIENNKLIIGICDEKDIL